MAPMRRVDDQIGIAGAVCRKPLAKSSRQLGKLLVGANQPANKIEKFQKLGQSAGEIQKLFAGSRQRDVVLLREPNNVLDFETAFEVDVDFRLRQGDKPAPHTPSSLTRPD